jgi:hypothetical protein
MENKIVMIKVMKMNEKKNEKKMNLSEKKRINEY